MTPARWRHAGAEFSLVLMVVGAAVAYSGVLRGYSWLYPVAMVACGTLGGAAVGRALRWHSALVVVAGLAGWTAAMCSMFFRGQSILGIIPGPETLGALREALTQAWDTVVFDTVPAAPNVGITAVLAGALGLIALIAETIALSCRLPAISGIAVLAALVVPAVLKPHSIGAAGFAAAAAGFLGLLATARPQEATALGGPRPPGERAAAAVSPGRVAALAAAIVVGTLVLPSIVPGFDRGLFPEGSRLRSLGQNVGLNPLITLGNDLRSAEGVGVLRYATNASAPLYLRTVTVEDFEGGSWGPDNRDDELEYPLSTISQRVSLAGAAQTATTVTVVATGGFTSPYLPAPYAPTAVEGARGRFGWDPQDLSIKGEPGASRDQFYIVRSVMPELTPAALATAGAPPRGIGQTAQSVPRGVPGSVRTTAETVTSGAGTAYGRALALQAYLRTFQYSEETPVEDGYDGTGMEVLETFLEKRSGYCIHFSAAMAVMSRIVGIPSRIAVGFAPGRPTGQTVSVPGPGLLPEFSVDGRDAHAWPELYFEGLGWVPFEPTPSRGVTPSYALTDALGISTGTNFDDLTDSLDPGAFGPAPSVTPPATQPGTGGGAQGTWVPALLTALAVLGAVLLALLPAAARAAQRRRRLARGLSGIWEELEAVGADHGLAPDPADTPRAYAQRLEAWEAQDGRLRHALATLTREYERHEFGRPGYEPDEDAARRAVADVQRVGRRVQRPVDRARIAALPPSSFAAIGRALRASGRGVRRAGRAAVRPLTPLAPAARAAGARAAAVWRRLRER